MIGIFCMRSMYSRQGRKIIINLILQRSVSITYAVRVTSCAHTSALVYATPDRQHKTRCIQDGKHYHAAVAGGKETKTDDNRDRT